MNASIAATLKAYVLKSLREIFLRLPCLICYLLIANPFGLVAHSRGNAWFLFTLDALKLGTRDGGY